MEGILDSRVGLSSWSKGLLLDGSFMHGRREGEESKGLPRQHMCPVGIDSDKSTTDKDLPSPASTSLPPDRSRSLSPSSDYFLKVDIMQLFDCVFCSYYFGISISFLWKLD